MSNDFEYLKVESYIPLSEDNSVKGGKFGFKQFQTLYNPNIHDDEENENYKGKLYPLYIRGENNKGFLDGIEMNTWYRCGQGELKAAFMKETGLPKLAFNGTTGLKAGAILSPEFFEKKGFSKEEAESIFEEYKDKYIKIGVDARGLNGTLSYRPGWHLGSAPVTRHIGTKDSLTPVFDKNGNPVMTKGEPKFLKKDAVDSNGKAILTKSGKVKQDYVYDDKGNRVVVYPKGKEPKQKQDYGKGYSQNVWALVEYSAEKDMTEYLEENKDIYGKNGITDFRSNDLFRGTYYHYQTNTNADSDEDWIIADAIKVVKILTDEEVEYIASKHGLVAQKRHSADSSKNNMFTADISQFKNSEGFENLNNLEDIL